MRVLLGAGREGLRGVANRFRRAHLSGLWEGVGKQPCVVRGRAAARLAAWRERHEGARSSARPRSRGGESECAGLRRRRGCCRRDRGCDRRRHGVLDLRLDQLIVLLLLTHEIAPIIAHPIGPISTATPISRPGAPLLRLAPHRPRGGAARGRDPDGGTLSARLGQQRRRRLAASSNGEQHRRCEHVGRNLELAFLGVEGHRRRSWARKRCVVPPSRVLLT